MACTDIGPSSFSESRPPPGRATLRVVNYPRNRLAIPRSRFRAFTDGLACPFLIALIARALMRATDLEQCIC